MKAREFDLIEAPMNPASFAAAVDTGTSKGVLVGFEFEVCVPREVINQATGKKPKKINTRTVDDLILNVDLADIPVDSANIDTISKLLPIKKTGQYPDLKSAYEQFSLTGLEEVKELFYQVPEEYRKKAIARAKRILKNDNKELTPENFSFAFGSVLYNYFDGYRGNPGSTVIERIGRRIRRIANALKSYGRNKTIDLEDLIYFATGWVPDLDQNLSKYFNYNPAEVYEFFQLSEFEDDNDDYYDEYDYDYPGAAKTLKPAIERIMGTKVKVFDEYHQSTKNLKFWYIEPDGSLNPNDRDGAAEIVTPPLPAGQAIAALKNFYQLAKELQLYTGADNSTGIHINVSIPDKIDVLKLALFVGDQYVLKKFGREANRYAESVLAQLQKRLNPDRVLDVKTLRGQHDLGPGKEFRFDKQILKSIIGDITSDHYASVSDSGKYISFRHAGGDYISQPTEILNVVGRFVRAMIIASDPELYKQEYMSKLAKLVGQYSTVPTAKDHKASVLQVISYIRQKGLPALRIDMITDRNIRLALLAKNGLSEIDVRSAYYELKDLPTDNNTVQNFSAFAASNRDLEERLATAKNNNFGSILAIPDEAGSMNYFEKISNIPDRPFYVWSRGWIRVSQIRLPIQHPVASEFALKLYKEIKK